MNVGGIVGPLIKLIQAVELHINEDCVCVFASPQMFSLTRPHVLSRRNEHGNTEGLSCTDMHLPPTQLPKQKQTRTLTQPEAA